MARQVFLQLFALTLVVSHAAYAQREFGELTLTGSMENQGRIESLDIPGQRITVNGLTYTLDPQFKVIQQTTKGPVELNPYRLNSGVLVGVEDIDGIVHRLHVLGNQ